MPYYPPGASSPNPYYVPAAPARHRYLLNDGSGNGFGNAGAPGCLDIGAGVRQNLTLVGTSLVDFTQGGGGLSQTWGATLFTPTSASVAATGVVSDGILAATGCTICLTCRFGIPFGGTGGTGWLFLVGDASLTSYAGVRFNGSATAVPNTLEADGNGSVSRVGTVTTAITQFGVADVPSTIKYSPWMRCAFIVSAPGATTNAVKLYINNTSSISITKPKGTTTMNTFSVGGGGVWGNSLNILCNDFALYDYEFTTAQIAADYYRAKGM